MDIENIQQSYWVLSKELKVALSRMELTDKVMAIRDEIKELQSACPHNNGTFDFSTTAECPYCGKKFKE